MMEEENRRELPNVLLSPPGPRDQLTCGNASKISLARKSGERKDIPMPPAQSPTIVCLCGSTRYYEQFQQANYELTMRGEIVLSVGFYPHATAAPGHGEGVGPDSAAKAAL